jgi:hypothetical protein
MIPDELIKEYLAKIPHDSEHYKQAVLDQIRRKKYQKHDKVYIVDDFK